MNLMLLDHAVEELVLEAGDPRAQHVRNVLRMGPGEQFDVGAENGPRGKALIVTDDAGGMRLKLSWGETPRPPLPVVLVLGLSRPQTMRKVLREAASLDLGHLLLFRSDRGEPSYASSSLWSSGEWETQLRQGTEQAFTTFVPVAQHADSLEDAVKKLAGGPRLALDNYEATEGLPGALAEAVGKVDTNAPLAVAVGSERGWSARERDVLRAAGFTLAHLGPRVLRTETAVTAAAVLTAAAMGRYAGGSSKD